MRYLFAAMMSVSLGVAVGMVPFVNEHLHWTFFFVIPISGLCIGAALGWLQFKLLRVTQAKLTKAAILFLSCAGAAGFVATDVGVYLSMSVPAEEPGAEPIPLCQVASFPEYMSYRLSGSTLSHPGKDGEIEIGRTGTTITFLVDLLGAMFGAGCVLFTFGDDSPYCEGCRRYHDVSSKLERALGTTAEEANGRFEQLLESADTGGYDGLTRAMLNLPPLAAESTVKLMTTELVCQGCRKGTLLATVHHRSNKNPWTPIAMQTIRLSSEKGQAPRLEA